MMRSGAFVPTTVSARFLAGLLSLAAVVFAASLPLLTGSAQARQTDVAGKFDYLTLVLSWSPTYCADNKGRDRLQCAGPRPYAFVLHGLWPQNERGWPENCRTRERPWVPRPVIDGMLDIMPSPRLVIHQFRKHGVCSGLEAGAYFALARSLYESVTIPAQFHSNGRPIVTTAEEVEADFLAVNTHLVAEGLSVVCGRRGHLREIRLCFSRDGKPMACGSNESQGRLCNRRKIVLPPVR